VVSAAEEAWNDMAGALDSAAADLSGVEVLGDQDLAFEMAEMQADLDQLRGLLNTDPLGGQANPAAACLRAAAKITAAPPVPVGRADLSARIVALDTLLTAGRWTRLSSELDLIERELASATSNSRDTERTVAALLGRRDELRGLFDAYQAKAARLGATEDPSLAARYDQARELLWTAPCDLTAAADAVNRFQQAVLAVGAQRL
jgi:hypothetical protein